MTSFFTCTGSLSIRSSTHAPKHIGDEYDVAVNTNAKTTTCGGKSDQRNWTVEPRGVSTIIERETE